ncbi:MAG: hypothetical protein PHH11_15650, partial [Methylomonas sp.]|nr:hypothetical protein [Methylomonas sp.]
MLKSAMMNLSLQERHWLPWFGKTGVLAMRWATLINRRRYPVLEQTFEGIAATRVNILTCWAQQHWAFMDGVAEELMRELSQPSLSLLQGKIGQAHDFSELFVIDMAGRVRVSTYAKRNDAVDLPAKAVAEGLKARFLHGPYVDRNT